MTLALGEFCHFCHTFVTPLCDKSIRAKSLLTASRRLVFLCRGTSVTCVTDIGGAAGDVALPMDIYSIVNLEPCDRCDRSDKSPDYPEKPLYGIKNEVPVEKLLSQDL